MSEPEFSKPKPATQTVAGFFTIWNQTMSQHGIGGTYTERPQSVDFIDNFNNFTNGPLKNQGNWLETTNDFSVQNSIKYEGEKAVKESVAATRTAYRTSPMVERAEISCYLRRDTAWGSGGNFQIIAAVDQNNKSIAEIGFMADDIVYCVGGAFIPILENCTLTQWYKVTLQFKTIPVPLARYKVDNGAWTEWVNRAQVGSADWLKSVIIQTIYALSAHECYFDLLSMQVI